MRIVVYWLFVGFWVSVTACKKEANPLLGHWKSQASPYSNQRLDFNIDFRPDETFEVVVNVMDGEQLMYIKGSYEVRNDTLLICDQIDKPLKLCDYTDTGRYVFKPHNKSVDFRVVDDKCERRRLTFEIGFMK